MREGDNMMKDVIRMLGYTSEIINESGVDCTPYPFGDVSLAKNLKNRNEYGSNSEFIPKQERVARSKLNRGPFRDDSRRKRKSKTPFKSGSDGAESKIDKPAVINKSNTQQNRDCYFGHTQPNLMEHNYDKKNINAQKLVGRDYQERTFSEKRPCNDFQLQLQWNAVRPKTVPSFSLQERNISQTYNPSALPTQSDLQTDIELKSKWTRKKPSTLTNGLLPTSISNGKSWRPLQQDMENLYKWTPEKLQRLQERIRAREKCKGLYGGKGKHCPSEHEKQHRRLLHEQSSQETYLFKENSLAIGEISEKNWKGRNRGNTRMKYTVQSNIKILRSNES